MRMAAFSRSAAALTLAARRFESPSRMYSRTSSSPLTYIIGIPPSQVGTVWPFPGSGSPRVPWGPWQEKHPARVAMAAPRRTALDSCFCQ
jgi:hypothetical protein